MPTAKFLILLSLAALGQAPQPPRSRIWVEAVNQVDGKIHLISCWLAADGKPRFDPREYPDFVAKSPSLVAKPKANPKPAKLDPNPRPDILSGPHPPQPAHRDDWPFPEKGVIESMMPRPVAGQGWYGGNVPKVIERGREPSKARPPDVHLTVIGTEPEQVAVRHALEADTNFQTLKTAMGDRLAIQYYGPTDPMVARVGLVDGGRPGVIIQDATGAERKRYHTDPGVIPIIAEIRKADPDYRPGREDEASSLGISGPAMLALAVGVGILVMLTAQQYKATHP